MKKHKDLYREIGDRIRIARESRGLTQEKLADAIDVSTQFVSDMERGIHGPSIHTLILICQHLQVSSDFLLMGITEQPSSSDPFAGLRYLSDDRKQDVFRSVRLLHDVFGYHTSPPESSAEEDLT